MFFLLRQIREVHVPKHRANAKLFIHCLLEFDLGCAVADDAKKVNEIAFLAYFLVSTVFSESQVELTCGTAAA